MTATAVYARISLDRQDGAGVDRQLKECRTLVKRQGWGPVQEYVDNSVSAFSGKLRPQYTAMLDAVRAGDVDRVVVYHVDRLYRRPRELEDLIDLAERGRVQVATCQGDVNLSTDSGITMARILVTMANQESRNTSRRIKLQKAQARENGQPVGGPRAFGWQDSMTPDAKEAALLSRAVDDLLAGASLNDVARRWNLSGVLQPQTQKSAWTADGIRQLVSNPRHCGMVGHRVHQGEDRYARPVVMGPAHWAALIDRDRWERLRAVLAYRGANGHVPRRRSLLTGLVTCEHCHRVMTRSGSRAGGALRRVWRCFGTGAKRGGCGRSIDAAGLEQLLTAATLRLADTRRFAVILRQQGRQGDAASGLLDQLGALDHRLDSLATTYATGKLSASAYQKATTAIQREQRALQARLGRVSVTGVVAPFAGRPGALRKAWADLTVDQQRTIIGLALGSVTIGPAVVHGRPHFDAGRVHWNG